MCTNLNNLFCSATLIIQYILVYILVKDERLPGFIFNVGLIKDTTGIKNSSLIINLAFDWNAIQSLSRHI